MSSRRSTRFSILDPVAKHPPPACRIKRRPESDCLDKYEQAENQRTKTKGDVKLRVGQGIQTQQRQPHDRRKNCGDED